MMRGVPTNFTSTLPGTIRQEMQRTETPGTPVQLFHNFPSFLHVWGTNESWTGNEEVFFFSILDEVLSLRSILDNDFFMSYFFFDETSCSLFFSKVVPFWSQIFSS